LKRGDRNGKVAYHRRSSSREKGREGAEQPVSGEFLPAGRDGAGRRRMSWQE
jgi:hypothetical protein